MNRAFLDYYKLPHDLVNFSLDGVLSKEPGFFRFGQEVLCYGRCSLSSFESESGNGLQDTLDSVWSTGKQCYLPFDPTEVLDNLRFERYPPFLRKEERKRFVSDPRIRQIYYKVRPFLATWFRKYLQRIFLRDWQTLPFPQWPLDTTVETILERLMSQLLKTIGVKEIPFIWFWPYGFSSSAMVTHDVESAEGLGFCSKLMDIDDSYGIKSSFQIVPEGRYSASADFLNHLRERGFELNIHDLYHDGRLFDSRSTFNHRVKNLNQHAKRINAIGFRSGAMYREVEWLSELDFSYDMSVPNVAHLDPQRGGCCTVTPYFAGRILELPLTTTQDYSLFSILNDFSLDLWKKQIDLIRKKHGLISILVHPDYLLEERRRRVYKSLLAHLSQLRSNRNIWVDLPANINAWWRDRAQMELVQDGDVWRIEGPGSKRACVAYAYLSGDQLDYHVVSPF